MRRCMACALTLLLFSTIVLGDPPTPTGFVQPANDLPGLLQQVHSTDANERVQAIYGLIYRSEPAALDAIIAALKDNNENVRGSAIEAIRENPCRRSMEALVNVLRDDGALRDRAMSASFVFKSDTVATVDAVLPLLDDANADVRRAAITILCWMSDARVKTALLSAAKDADPNVRSAAVIGLFRNASDTDIQNVLLDLATDPSPGIRRRVIRELPNINLPKALPLLRAACNDPDAAVRASAVLGLDKMGIAEAYPLLVAAAHDQDSGVRANAIYTLGITGATDAYPLLIEALHDQDAGIRTSAIRGLMAHGDPRAGEAIIPLLSDPAIKVRRQACEAMGELRVAKATDMLLAVMDAACADRETEPNNVPADHFTDANRARSPLEMWETNDRFLAEAAADALVKIGGPALHRLTEAASDERTRIRYAVLRALSRSGNTRVLGTLGWVAQTDPDVEIRKLAISCLSDMKDARAVPILISLLKEPDFRTSTLQALTILHDLRAVEPVLALLQTDDTEKRRRIAYFFRFFDDPRVKDALATLLDDQDSGLRRDALLSLAELKDPRAFTPLCALMQETNVITKVRAATLLGGYRQPESVDLLLKTLDDPDRRVQTAAIRALGQTADTRAVDPLLALLRSNHADVRGTAADSLGSFSDPRIADALLPLLQDGAGTDPATTVCGFAAQSLGKLHEARAVPALVSLFLSDDNTTIVSITTDALAQIGQPAVQPLLDAMKDAQPGTRTRAIALLEQIGDPAALTQVRGYLNDPNQYVQAAAISALGSFHDAESIPAMLRALEDKHSSVRIAAAGALGKLREQLAVPVFIARLRTLTIARKDDRERSACIDALGAIGDATAVDALLPFVKEDIYTEFRGTILRALGNIGDPKPLPAILDLLTTEVDPAVRVEAAKALGRFKDQRAIPILLTMLKDETPAPRTAAANALKSITGQDFGTDVVKWHAWWEREKK